MYGVVVWFVRFSVGSILKYLYLYLPWCSRIMVMVGMGVRNHGFERPLDSRQVSSWITFSLFLAAFFVLYSIVHTDTVGIALTCLYSVCTVATIYTGWRAMYTDPSDRSALDKRTGKMTAIPESAAERKFFCHRCEAYVNQRSKHCKRQAPHYLPKISLRSCDRPFAPLRTE